MNTVKKTTFYLFMVFFSIYLLTTSGYGSYLADVCQARIEVAKSIVERFDLSIPDSVGMKGVDGRSYSWFGIGTALLTIPFHLAGNLTGVSTETLVSFLNPVAGACTIVLVFLFSVSLGYSRNASLLVAIFYGLGTMAWYYAKAPGDHALETLFVLSSIYCMYRYGVDRKMRHLYFAASAVGFAILIRPTSVWALPSLLLLMFSSGLRTDYRQKLNAIVKDTAIFVVVLSPFIGLYLWYNHYRFGSIFESGYSIIAERTGLNFFSGTSLLTGLKGLLVSPGKGFFFYAPVTVLFFFSIKRFTERHRYPAISFIVIILLYPLFYAKNIYWHGDWTWGPRYIFLTTPFYVIPAATIFDSASWQANRFNKMLICLLFAVSLTIQLASVSVFYDKYFYHLMIDKQVRFQKKIGEGVQLILEPPPEVYFEWNNSPILAQFRFMRELAGGMKSYKYVELSKTATAIEKVRTFPFMNLYDFWWVYEYFLHRNMTALFAALAMLGIIIYGSLALRKIA
jgi:hypothetical protein